MQEFDAVKKNKSMYNKREKKKCTRRTKACTIHSRPKRTKACTTGDKKLAETATDSAIWEKPDVHAGLVTSEEKIRPFFDNFSRMNVTSVITCLEHLLASHLTNFIHLTSRTKCLPSRSQNDKMTDKIRSDGVKDIYINTMEKAAQYSFELQSVFESKRVKPVVMKKFNPAYQRL